MDELLRAVDKAVALIAPDVLGDWNNSRDPGLNLKDLRTELLLVEETLGQGSGKQLDSLPYLELEELLRKLRGSADSAGDLLGELNYFRLHEKLPGTPAEPEEEVSRCMPRLRKLLLLLTCASSTHDNTSGQPTVSAMPQREHAQETPILMFDMVDASKRIKDIVEKLESVREELTAIVQGCPDISQIRPVTPTIVVPELYGRDNILNSIVHDITKGKYHDQELTVLPIVGQGGIGKTTLVQHVYHNTQVQNHFQLLIWVCVSPSFNPLEVFEELKKSIPRVQGEKWDRLEELIEQRLKSKRFLLVLDNIWEFSNVDEWKRFLLPLKRSGKKGNMILVTTRFPGIARMVRTVDQIELEGLESAEFRNLFHKLIFGDDQNTGDHIVLLETGDKIMEKLNGSPLAAKTAARLLRKDLGLRHWKTVLECTKWLTQTGANDIMPALKLSYDHLPFRLQQCFSCCALFPRDFCFSSSQLINFWIGLAILQPYNRNQTLEDMGLSNLNDLVMDGFFREEETNGRRCYVIPDLLHDLALKVASHECLTLLRSNVGSVDILPSIRHLSIIIDDDDAVDDENFKYALRELKTRLKVEHLQTLMLFGEVDGRFANIFGDFFREANSLRVLHLLGISYPVESMLRNFSTLVHLRYLFLGTRPRELMHRFLCLGTGYETEMHLPPAISRFYELRILDLRSWYGHCDFPSDMSNLKELRHLYTQKDELHSAICNVGNLRVLKELKVFRVNKESEGFEPKQLEHLTELSELGIYNLERIHTKEAAAKAKLIEKTGLQKLTLDWDSERSNVEPDVEAVVLESLQPHRDLEELCIRGHGGSSCPAWLGDKLDIKALESLHLDGVSWEVLPSLGSIWGLRKLILKHIATVKEFAVEPNFCRLIWFELVGLESFERWVPSWDAPMLPLLQVLIIRDCPKLSELPFSNHFLYPPEQHRNIDWFPKLKELEIEKCPELLTLPPIPWTKTLCSVSIRGVMLLEKLIYSNSSHGVRLDIVGKDDLHSLDQVLAFSNLTELEELALVKCPPLGSKHLVMLTSLKTLIAESSFALVEPLGGHGDVEWKLPVEHIEVQELWDYNGKELTELLTHLPRLSKLEITECGKITHLVVGVDLPQTMSVASVEKAEIPPPAAAAAAAGREKEEDGAVLLPTHLSNTLRELVISHCPELVLVAPHQDGRRKNATFLPDGGGFQALRCLQRLKLKETPNFLSACLLTSPSCRLFPSSLQFLELNGVEGMETVEPLSNLTSLTILELRNCGENLRCKGLGPLLTAGGQLRVLYVYGSPGFFAGWDLNPRQVMQDEGEQQLQLVSPLSSSKLKKLWTDDVTGLLAEPICSLLSSSLSQLQLSGTKEMERFSKDQEEALHLLTSILELKFFGFDKLQYLPAGLHMLNLIELQVCSCPSLWSLPWDGLPRSLQKLDVLDSGNEVLIHQSRALTGILPNIRLEF